MKQIVMLIIGAALLLVTGCERKEVKVHARHHAPDTKAERVVTRWKEMDSRISSYGMIIEQEGAKVSATLYRVEPGEGFVIKEKESDGRYFPAQKELVFPCNKPDFLSFENWLSADGSRVVVPFDAQDAKIRQATNLVGQLKDPARKSTYNFSRLPSEALPSILNTSTGDK